MKRDIVQAALPVHRDLGQSFNRFWKKFSLGDDAKPARLFGDEYPAIGQKRERPRLL